MKLCKNRENEIFHTVVRNIGRVTRVLIVALAFTMIPISQATAGEPGAYIGLGIGASDYKEGSFSKACDDLGVECGTDTADVGVEIFGGYQFNPYLSLEGGWVTYGEVEAENEILNKGILLAEAKGLSITVIPELPLAKHFSLYGRLGVVFADTTIELGELGIGGGSSIKESSNATGFNYGIGGMLHFGRWDIRLQASQTDFNKSVTVGSLEVDIPKVNLLSLGVVFRFPK